MYNEKLVAEVRGMQIYHGTRQLDPGNWTVQEAIASEAGSSLRAIARKCSTTVDPSTGVYVDWDEDHAVAIRAWFNAQLEKLLEEGEELEG